MSWRVQFRMGQPRRMHQETFTDEHAARQFGALVDRVGAEAAIAVKDARNGSDVGVPTLAEFAAVFYDPASGHLTGVQEDTRRDYIRNAKKSFLAVLGDLPVDAVTKPDVGRWIAWQESQDSGRTKGIPMSAKTVRNYHAQLSAVFKAAVESGYRPDNPARSVRISRGRKHEPVFLSRDEFATLLHFIPAYYKPLVMFLAGTGVRWSEGTALERRDVNTDATPTTVRVSKAWKKDHTIGTTKTDKGRRTISLWTEIVAELKLDGPGSELLFQGMQNGGRLWYGNFKARIWDRAVSDANDVKKCDAAGLSPIGKRPTPHDCRHTHASWLIAAGAPLPFVQARLGHEKITTTVDTYGHLLPDAHVQMSAIMQATMSGVLPALAAAPTTDAG